MRKYVAGKTARSARVLAILAAVLAIDCKVLSAQEGPIRFERLGAAEGARQYRGGRWGVVGVDITNASDEPAEVMASVGLEEDGTLRYARKIWVPPKSLRRTWAPLRIPKKTTTNRRQEIYCQLIQSHGGVEQVKSRDYEYEQHTSSLRLVNQPYITGVITDLGDYRTGQTLDPRYESVIASRAAASLGRQVALIGSVYLPSLPEAYDAIDQLVIYNDRFAEDPVACAAIRAWLNAGGVIWLHLDRVELAGVAKLLGERFRCEEVDRVELNSVEIVTVKKRSGITYTGKRDFELPAPMVRVAVEDVTVTHEVEGWPAAFTMPYGRGKVIVTAVGGQAWLATPAQARDYSLQGHFDASIELSELSVTDNRVPTPATVDVFSNYLTEQIGYEVVGRTPIVLTLSVFCAFLLTAGIALARRGRLEQMAWVAPLSAVLASLPMIWLGLRSQNSAPSTVVMGQYVEIGDSSNSASVSGALAFYQPEPATVSIGANNGGVFEPEFQGIGESIRRMVWTDMDRWKWERIRLMGGVRRAEIRHSLRLPETVEARGAFDESGFRGSLMGGLPLTDALIATPSRPGIAARIQDGEISAAATEQLAEGEFIAEAILSDEQRRRQQVYQTMFANDSRDRPYPTRRLLLGWTDPFDLQFEFPEGVRKIGAALVAIPLSIDAPKSGQRMLIPSSFVHLQTVAGPSGVAGGSPLYNMRTGQWVEAKSASQIWLRCSPPAELLPAKIDKAVIRMKATIPSRKLTIASFTNGQVAPVFERANVIGPIEITIDGANSLALDSENGFLLGIMVSEEVDPSKQAGGVQWKVDYLQVEIHASAE
jgi:hypothetical protein